jgi:hypothetical protein
MMKKFLGLLLSLLILFPAVGCAAKTAVLNQGSTARASAQNAAGESAVGFESETGNSIIEPEPSISGSHSTKTTKIAGYAESPQTANETKYIGAGSAAASAGVKSFSTSSAFSMTGANSTTAIPSVPGVSSFSSSSVPKLEIPIHEPVGVTDNIAGNLHHGGLVAEQDGRIYFRHKGSLYRTYSNGRGGVQLLCDDRPAMLNVVGNWIYYRNDKENRYLYKIGTDGTGRQLLNAESCESVLVVDNWIYYANVGDNNSLYRIYTDGTQRQKLNNENSWYFAVDDGWIYYINWDGGNIYKMRTDGKQRQRISTDIAGNLNIENGWLYFCNNNLNDSGYGSIYKMKMDGTQRQQLNNENSYQMNVAEGWIYYCGGYNMYSSAEQGIYKMRTDGTERQLIRRTTYVNNICIIKNLIYFKSSFSSEVLNYMHTDGTGLTQIGIVHTY